MSEPKSRRSVLKYGAAAIGGLAIGSVAGWTASQAATPPPKVAKWGVAPPAGTQVSLINGCDPAYPPFTSVDTSGNAFGFDIDCLQVVANQYGWTVTTKPWEWSSIITALLNGDLDMVWSGMTVTAARSSVVWFTMPYYSYIHRLLALATQTGSEQDILNSGKTIAVQTGATADLWATKLLAAGDTFQKLPLDSQPACIQAMSDGRAVGAIMDSSYLDVYLRDNPDVAAKFRVVGNVGGMSVYAIATRIEDVWLRNQINAALENLMGSTKFTEITTKWNLA